MDKLVLIILTIIVIAVLVWVFILYQYVLGTDGYYWINIWNEKLSKYIINETHEGLPDSMQYAEISNLPAARKINRLISESHDEILKEVNSLISKGYHGYPMSELDEVQSKLEMKGSWNPIWIKFIDKYAGTARHLPIMKQIAEKMGSDIFMLHISVFWPGTELNFHEGPSKGVMRYHYGLQIPKGNTGLILNGKGYKWRNKEGVIWDDTLTHKAWNKTELPRIVIFADIPRKLPIGINWMNKRIHRFIQNTKHIQKIQETLVHEGSEIIPGSSII